MTGSDNFRNQLSQHWAIVQSQDQQQEHDATPLIQAVKATAPAPKPIASDATPISSALHRFRRAYPYMIYDGRRFKTLACAGHSLANLWTPDKPVVEETWDVGEAKWQRMYIAKYLAVYAYEQERRMYPVPEPNLG